jgi:hypothetical protein
MSAFLRVTKIILREKGELVRLNAYNIGDLQNNTILPRKSVDIFAACLLE